MILVSACLLGINCKYNGGNNRIPALAELCQQGRLVPVCPEMLGGLPIPRPPAEIRGGSGSAVLAGKAKVVNREGNDVTAAFLRGAEETLTLARLFGAKKALLKESSPSCGSSTIYDGTFTGTKKAGEGVTTALLRSHGIEVFSEKELKKLLPEENQ